MPPPYALLNGVRLLLVNDLVLSLLFSVCCVMKVGLSVANQVGGVEQTSTLNLTENNFPLDVYCRVICERYLCQNPYQPYLCETGSV